MPPDDLFALMTSMDGKVRGRGLAGVLASCSMQLGGLRRAAARPSVSADVGGGRRARPSAPPCHPCLLALNRVDHQPPKMIIDPFPREHHSELLKPLRLAGGDARVVYTEAPRFAGLLRPRVWAGLCVLAAVPRGLQRRRCAPKGAAGAPSLRLNQGNVAHHHRCRRHPCRSM